MMDHLSPFWVEAIALDLRRIFLWRQVQILGLSDGPKVRGRARTMEAIAEVRAKEAVRVAVVVMIKRSVVV